MTPFSDVRVHDLVVFDEIELYGELIIAASQSEGPLTQAEIDAVLGIGAARQAAGAAPWSDAAHGSSRRRVENRRMGQGCSGAHEPRDRL
ncbi:MAG TPA: hypothetical protein VLH10_05875 [Yinghuangia sp.]|uniref:hypothetical protein n=1 Tax=Yinghuangia sp. YIM S10712 TaxID=3436930 RepID=UPI002BE3397D|nr:hypothetical protein [Yinghuangia sp.]